MVFPLNTKRRGGVFDPSADPGSFIFNGVDASFSYAPASDGDRKTYTIEFVFRRIPNTQQILLSAIIGSYEELIRINANNSVEYYRFNGSAYRGRLVGTDVLGDFGVYHLALRVNAAAGTAEIDVSGETLTNFSTNSALSNEDGAFFSTGTHRLGRHVSSAIQFFNGSMSRFAMYSGVNLGASDLGKYGDGGKFIPSGYNGPYSSDDTRLGFNDDTSATTLGVDDINGNNWTPSAGVSTDDHEGGSWSNEFAILNAFSAGAAVSDGGLKTARSPSASHPLVKSTLPLTGVVYFEAHATLSNYTAWYIGFCEQSSKFSGPNGVMGELAGQWSWDGFSGVYWDEGTDSAATDITQPSSASDYICWCVDVEAGKAWLGTHSGGVIAWQGGGDPDSGTSPTISFTTSERLFASIAGSDAPVINFGQKPFATSDVPVSAQKLRKALFPKPASAASVTPLTGSFEGTATADNNHVYLGYAPDQSGTCTINGNAITWGTHAIATNDGFYTITGSPSYNASGSNTYSIAVKYPFGGKGIAPAPAQVT